METNEECRQRVIRTSDERGEFVTEDWAIKLWWHRNFYPDFQTVANDLHARGLLDAGEHTIIIDW